MFTVHVLRNDRLEWQGSEIKETYFGIFLSNRSYSRGNEK